MKSGPANLQRQPFLVPIWLSAALALLGIGAFALAVWIWATASSTLVIVVRHAEKDLAASATEPPLSVQGQERAQLLARMFGERGSIGRLDAIYVSPALRNRQTGEPLAQRLGIAESIVSADDPRGLAQRVLRQHRGGRVLIIAHSDTLPIIVAELSGHAHISEIKDQEYGTMYFITVPRIGRPNLLRLSY